MNKKILISTLALLIIVTAVYNFAPETIRLPLIKLNRTSAGLSTKIITTGDHTIHYLEGGSGPTVILLHGIFSEKDHWVDFARHLTKEYHVIIPDLAGFGDSTRLKNINYSYEDQVKIFDNFVHALKISSFHIAGNSMGGTIAALYSIEHKDKVKSVAFIGAPHGIKTHGLSEMDIHLNNGRFPLVPKSEKEFDNMMNLLFNKQPFIPSPILKHSKAQAIAQSGDNLRIFNQQFKERYLLHSKLPEVSVPIFALWGEHERIFHPDGATNIKGISKAKIIVKMIDTGHLPQMESPTESAELYKLFLRN